MPKGTKVHAMFDALKRHGYPVSSAARIAQAKTKQSLATGLPLKKKRKRKIG